jgi:hypothetical protein
MVFSLFFDNTHGLSFHFYLYSVRDENTFYFENFEKSFFIFCLLQIFCSIFFSFLVMLVGHLFIFA